MSTEQSQTLTTRPLIPDGVYVVRQNYNLLTTNADGNVSTQAESTADNSQKWDIKYDTASHTYTVTNSEFKTFINREKMTGPLDRAVANDTQTKWQIVEDSDGQDQKFMIGLWDGDVPEWLDNQDGAMTIRGHNPVTRRERQRWTLDIKELSLDQPYGSSQSKETSPPTVPAVQDRVVPEALKLLKLGQYYNIDNVQSGNSLVAIPATYPKVAMWELNPAGRRNTNAGWQLAFSPSGGTLVMNIYESAPTHSPQFLSDVGMKKTAYECELRPADEGNSGPGGANKDVFIIVLNKDGKVLADRGPKTDGRVALVEELEKPTPSDAQKWRLKRVWPGEA